MDVSEGCSLWLFKHLVRRLDLGMWSLWGVVACRNQIHFFREKHWKMFLQPGGGGGLLCKAHLQLVNHRLFSYHSFGASNTYFGDRVAFVLCSVWLGASTDHSCCLVTYSSCRKFLLRAAHSSLASSLTPFTLS